MTALEKDLEASGWSVYPHSASEVDGLGYVPAMKADRDHQQLDFSIDGSGNRLSVVADHDALDPARPRSRTSTHGRRSTASPLEGELRSGHDRGRERYRREGGRLDDLAQIVAIYNHYIINTPITFDLDAVTVEERKSWFAQFSPTGRHRLIVADRGGIVIGYAGSHQFRTKAAYDTTVETTVLLAARWAGHRHLAVRHPVRRHRSEDIHSLLAGITLPNEASVALHERFGFSRAGVTHAVGANSADIGTSAGTNG